MILKIVVLMLVLNSRKRPNSDEFKDIDEEETNTEYQSLNSNSRSLQHLTSASTTLMPRQLCPCNFCVCIHAVFICLLGTCNIFSTSFNNRSFIFIFFSGRSGSTFAGTAQVACSSSLPIT